MTDNELNAMVAEKVMGHTIQWVNGVPFLSYKKGTAPGSPYVLSDGTELHSVPNFCNDIAAAWQGALKIASMWGYGVTIHIGDEVVIERTMEAKAGNSHIITWQDVARVGTAQGDARAICLAALQAVGVEVEE